MSALFKMKRRKRRVGEQLELRARTWGGKRDGAGRKRHLEKPNVAHRMRPAIRRRSPLHVTLRMEPRVYGLRSKRSFRVIESALRRKGARRFDAQVVRF